MSNAVTTCEGFVRTVPGLDAPEASGGDGVAAPVRRGAKRQRTRRPSPYRRTFRLGDMDGRSREARLMVEVTRELVEHVGGKPNPAQRMLIDRIAALRLRLALLDEAMMRDPSALSPHALRFGLAAQNTLRLCLRELGIETTPAPARTLDELLAERSA